MKTLTAGMTAHINSELTTIATCIRVVQEDGTEHRFTDHDEEIVVSGLTGDDAQLNGTYTADTVGYTRSAVESRSNLGVDNFEFQGLLDLSAISDDDVRAGLFDKATFHMFLVNYESNADEIIRMKKGTLGKMDLKNGEVIIEMRGMMHPLSLSFLPLYTPDCRNQVGDARCGVELDPPAWVDSTLYNFNLEGDALTGGYVSPGTYNDRIFRAETTGTSGGVEPTWDLTVGNFTSEAAKQMATSAGTITFTLDTLGNDTIERSVGTWDAGDGFIATDSIVVTGTAINDGTYTIAAITGGTVIEIAGDLLENEVAVASDFPDFRIYSGSGLIWETLQARTLPDADFTITSATNNADFFIAGSPTTTDAPTGYFDAGIASFTTGANTGFSRAITKSTGGTNRVETFLPFPFDIQVGDSLRLIVGCKRRIIEDCKDKFKNTWNHNGEAYLPKEDFVFSTPDPPECKT
jgi:hypothetical protein